MRAGRLIFAAKTTVLPSLSRNCIVGGVPEVVIW
jgi:hypothetical protein